jgi:hypothetical protein
MLGMDDNMPRSGVSNNNLFFIYTYATCLKNETFPKSQLK